MEVGQVMRTFGWTPTEGELQELIGVIDQDGKFYVAYADRDS